MKKIVKILNEIEVDIKKLEIKAHVRYWEDSEINGVKDIGGNLTPFRKGDLWCPVIDIDSGIIQGWPIGTTASIHLKVVDRGSYFLKDSYGYIIASIENNYVPIIACPEYEGYGDYIIMNIFDDGIINKWNPTFYEFFEDVIN